jgi:dTMP kinase
MATGMFITFEGGEGAGKSTQAAFLAERLRQAGHDVIVTREPGGTAFAEAVRSLILSPATPAHSALSEALLFYAARADHLERLIRPALAAGRWVICDRFSDSSRVYQSIVGGLAPEVLDRLEAMVVAATRPDLTVVLDLPAETGLARASARRTGLAASRPEADAYEKRDIDYHRRLRDGFRAIAAAEPSRCLVVDGTLVPEAIAEAVWVTVSSRARGS